MAHVSLYRKYRSQTFAEVVGQDHVTRTLATAVESGRLHHAYLFAGPRGTGKTSTARILAKAINCEAGPTATPCNTCGACEAITSGSHIDVIEIDAASHGGVDDVRDLRDRIAFAPAIARRKIYIVDECHMLSTAGWNAFLKTVEEPPPHVLFVFATTEPHKVLDTILSRTQRFDLRRISSEPLASLVRDIAGKEGIDIDAGAVAAVVRAGDGSARDTLSVLDQVVAYAGTTVTGEAVAEVLGNTPGELLDRLARLLAAGDVAGLMGLVSDLAESGGDPRQMARDAVDHLRSLFLLRTAPDARLVEATPERLVELTDQARAFGAVGLLRAVDLLAEAQAQMRRGATRLPLEIALAKAALPASSGDPAAVAARIDQLESRIDTAGPSAVAAPASAAAQPEPQAAPAAVQAEAEPQPEPEPEPEPAAAEAEAEPAPEPEPPPAVTSPAVADGDLEQVQNRWAAILETVRARRRTTHALLNDAEPVSLTGGELTLRFAHAFHADSCCGSEHAPVIVAAVEQVAGVAVRIRGIVGTQEATTAAPAEDQADAELQAQAAAVAETEHEETDPHAPDSEAVHRQALSTLTEELGAEVVDPPR